MAIELLRERLRPYYLKWFYWKLWPGRRPGYFTDAWNKPHFSLWEPAREFASPQAGHPDLLFLPMSDWHARIQRTQHLAMEFGARGSRCFYLNPHLGREFPGLYTSRNTPRVGPLAAGVWELHIHLPAEPVYHHRLLTARETDQLVSGIRRLAHVAKTTRLIQIVSFPLWTEAAERLRDEFGFPIVYDCHDLLGGFTAISEDVLAAERRLFETADMACFASQWLMDETAPDRPAIARKSLVVRNAVSPRDYAGVVMGNRTGAPTVGYVGALDFWFDAEAIRLSAVRHPEWRFVLIGRIESQAIAGLKALPNVFFEGEVPYSELASRMAGFDVAVIPFLKNPLTMATNPLKLYEYLCLGIPIVSTRLPETEPFNDLIYLSDDAAGFAHELEQAMTERDADLRARRKEAARNNTWGLRCDQLSERFRALSGTLGASR